MAAQAQTDNGGLPQTRSEWAADRLRSAILLAELGPGDEIRETHLAREWGLSPTPLREALRTLASEGLVVREAQRIARVAEISRDQSIDVYALRLVLEPLALRLSMMKGTSQRGEEVATACTLLSELTSKQPFDRREYEDAHREFHHLLVADCGSAALLSELRGLWDSSMRFRYVALREASAERQVPSAELLHSGHERLRDAYLSGEPDIACSELDEHIFSVLRSALSRQELDSVGQLRAELGQLAKVWELSST